jgi:signal transduction histidine kinase
MGENDKAYESYTRSIEIRKELGDKAYLASAVNNLGIWMAIQSRFDEALVYFNQYRDINMELKDTIAVATATMNLGNVNNDRGNYEKALEYYLESASLLNASSVKRESTRANLYLNIALIYSENDEFDQAISNTKKALTIYEDFNNKEDIRDAYQNIGLFFDFKNEADSALYYYDLALELSRELGNDRNTADILMNIGVVHNKANAPEFALEYLLEAEELFLNQDEAQPVANLYNNIGASYYYLGRYDQAINSYKTSYDLATQTEDLETQSRASFGLAEAYAEVGDYRNAFEYQVLYDTYKDSLMNIDRAEVIEELITKYETEQKEAEIELLTTKQAQSEAEIARQDAENRALFFGILALVFVVAGISGWFIYSNRKKKIIQQQKEALHQNEIESLIEKQSLESISSMLEGQEKERKRLAAELHDRLGSILSLVKMYFSSLDDDIKEKQPELYESFAEGNQILDDAFLEVRSLIKEMKEGKVSGNGLVKDVKDLLEKVKKLGIRVEQDISLESDLDSMIEMNVLRVIQEALTNSLKYSKATLISLQLREEENLKLKISDNGIGFSKEKGNDGRHELEHYGLGNMESRIKLLGGTFSLNSISGKGVEIRASIPLKKNETQEAG